MEPEPLNSEQTPKEEGASKQGKALKNVSYIFIVIALLLVSFVLYKSFSGKSVPGDQSDTDPQEAESEAPQSVVWISDIGGVAIVFAPSATVPDLGDLGPEVVSFILNPVDSTSRQCFVDYYIKSDAVLSSEQLDALRATTGMCLQESGVIPNQEDFTKEVKEQNCSSFDVGWQSGVVTSCNMNAIIQGLQNE